MSSPSENFVVNASQLSDIVKDWIDSAIESGPRNALEWLQQKLQEKIPNLDSDTVQSLASDISDYAKSVSSFREDLDLTKAKYISMSRQEWLYRKLKDIVGEKSEDAFGQILEKLGNGLLSQLEKTANEFGIVNGKTTPLTIFPDNSPPPFGWNSDSIKARVFDISKVLTALTISGLSQIDNNSAENAETIHLSDPEKFKEILLKGDQSKLIMAMTGALKEGVIKRVLIFEIGESISKDQNSHQSNTASDAFHSTSPSQNTDLPSLVNISSQSVEFARQCVSSENQPEKFLDGMIDSAMSTIAGIAKVALVKYGPVLLQSLFASSPFASIICKLMLPILCKTLLPMLGKNIVNLAVNTIIPKVGNMAKSFTQTMSNELFSKGITFCGIKNVVSSICSATSDLRNFVCGLFA
ncbi:MAG: hypothetical protein K6E31_00955 [bacterium]|nr:hypothetical protein [bacterium]